MGTMRFNHMELTLAPGTLDPIRSEISRFYQETFGWMPLDVNILGQNALLLGVDAEVSQFILVAENPKPMQSPGYDHLGVLVDTRAEVDELLAKCKEAQGKDERVKIKEYEDLVQGGVTVHAFYVKFLLPIYLDVQCIEWKKGSEPARRWTYG
jgi:hypothetical protein